MELPSLLTILGYLATAAEDLAPALEAMGIPAVSEAAKIAEAGAAVAATIQEAVAQGKIVATSNDQIVLTGLAETLTAQAQTLGAQVDAS
jgi:hypothetical protein